MERDGTPAGQHGASRLPEALDGLDPEARQDILDVIKLHWEFPAWAVWLPHAGRSWTAVRPASARAPSPDLPMIWVHAATAELAGRMRGVDGQLHEFVHLPKVHSGFGQPASAAGHRGAAVIAQLTEVRGYCVASIME